MKLNSLKFLVFAAFAAGHSHAALLAIDLGGNKETAGWGAPGGTALTTSNYPTVPVGPLPYYPAGTWAQPLPATYGEAASSSNLHKLNGGYYPASEGLYSWSTSSVFSAVNTATTLGSINTIVFQTETSKNPQGDPAHPDYDPDLAFTAPTLYLNGGTEGILPTWSLEALSGGTVGSGDQGGLLWHWAWQWDLSGVEEPITSYSFEWQQIVHSSLVAIQIDASDAVHAASVLAVPEPSALLLGCAGFALVLRRRHRR